jgi:hypothetical protein
MLSDCGRDDQFSYELSSDLKEKLPIPIASIEDSRQVSMLGTLA